MKPECFEVWRSHHDSYGLLHLHHHHGDHHKGLLLPGQAAAVTPMPVATTPILGAAHCEQPTWEERTTAPYTAWELNFQLEVEIMERIYRQLYPFFVQALCCYIV